MCLAGLVSYLHSSPTKVSQTVAFLLDTVFNLFCYMVFWCACNSHWLLISMPSSLSWVLRRMPLLLCRIDNFAELSDHDWNTLSSHEPRTPAHWCIQTFKASRYSILLLHFCLSGDIFSISDGRMRQLGPTLSEGQSTPDQQPPNLALSQPSHTPGSHSGNKQYRDQLQERQVDSWVPFCFFVIVFCLY